MADSKATAKIQFSKNKEDMLGKGAFSIVYKGRFDNKDVAVKRIQNEDVDHREEEFLRKYPHANILKFFHAEQDDNFRYFAFELCAGHLQDWADSKYNGPTPTDLIGLQQLASGLAFVHDQNHVHRDICPANILISSNGDRLIISDFGLCKRAHDSGSYSVSQRNGQEKWLAPERIKNKFDSSYRVTIHSDTWALGCVFYFFVTKGGHPFHDKNGLTMQKNVVEGIFQLDELPDNHASKSIIEDMIKNDAEQRPKMKDVARKIDEIVQGDHAFSVPQTRRKLPVDGHGQDDLHRAAKNGKFSSD